jgi:hypothetical protein
MFSGVAQIKNTPENILITKVYLKYTLLDVALYCA